MGMPHYRTRPPFGHYVHYPQPEVRMHSWLPELYCFVLDEIAKSPNGRVIQSRVVDFAAKLGSRLSRSNVPTIVKRAVEWDEDGRPTSIKEPEAGETPLEDDPFGGL